MLMSPSLVYHFTNTIVFIKLLELEEFKNAETVCRFLPGRPTTSTHRLATWMLNRDLISSLDSIQGFYRLVQITSSSRTLDGQLVMHALLEWREINLERGVNADVEIGNMLQQMTKDGFKIEFLGQKQFISATEAWMLSMKPEVKVCQID